MLSAREIVKAVVRLVDAASHDSVVPRGRRSRSSVVQSALDHHGAEHVLADAADALAEELIALGDAR